MSRPRHLIVTVPLPLPPSVNDAYAARRGSHLTMKTAAYKFWAQQVKDAHGSGQHLPIFLGGRYGLWLDLPATMKGDTDNRTKLVSDVLRAPTRNSYGLAVVLDDSLMGPHMIQPGQLADGTCLATVVAAEAWVDYVLMRLAP